VSIAVSGTLRRRYLLVSPSACTANVPFGQEEFTHTTTKFAEEPPDRPAGGHEEDHMTITGRDRIRQSTRRHATPNADYFRLPDCQPDG